MISCNTLSGILYPKVFFSFHSIGVQPPSNANDRLVAGAEFPQTFTFSFSQVGNSFKTTFIPTIFVDQLFNTLYIKEMSYEWDNKNGILIKNKSFNLSTGSYISNNNWYWLGGIHNFLRINFENIFTGIKSGDNFIFKLFITYSFDDSKEQTQILEYNVIATKGSYTSPFIVR